MMSTPALDKPERQEKKTGLRSTNIHTKRSFCATALLADAMRNGSPRHSGPSTYTGVKAVNIVRRNARRDGVQGIAGRDGRSMSGGTRNVRAGEMCGGALDKRRSEQDVYCVQLKGGVRCKDTHIPDVLLRRIRIWGWGSRKRYV
jgi:hypothetical protein